MTYLCICNMKNMFRTHDIVMFINDDISGGSRIKNWEGSHWANYIMWA